MAGLYLHIPFCRHACSYCSFYFSTQQSLINGFVEALIHEINTVPTETVKKVGALKTLYFGGGTPSLLPINAVSNILSAINTIFDTSLVEEITFELNPENANESYLLELKKLGINRLSMGIQSFHPHILRSMHRSHTKEQAIKAVDTIKSTGFDSFNIDLIYAYPGETILELEQDLATFIGLNPPHISAYSLTVEAGTRLKQQIDKGTIQELEEDSQAAHFELVSKTLAKAGFQHYETSNFAQEKHASKHNSNYWSHQNYLGFGPASHSFLWEGDKSAAKRWANPSDLNSYIQKLGILPREEVKDLTLQELAEERLMLALRTKNGLNLSEWEKLYKTELALSQVQQLQEWANLGYINESLWTQKQLVLTEKTFALADHLVYKLLTKA